MSTLTDAQRAELAAITARDASSNEMWFTGPRGSFTAAAAKDRRFLLELVHTLLRSPEEPQNEDLRCVCCGATLVAGWVVHAPTCQAIPSCTR